MKTTKNNLLVTLFSFILILIIGMLDYLTQAEISFSIFYLIPIILVASYRNIKKPIIIINTIFASIIWFFADIFVKDYSYDIIPVWNAVMRFSIFTIIGLLVFNLKEKQNKQNQINHDLVKINDEKNKFIGIAAHDLRNPIGAIASLSDLILSEYSDKLDEKILKIMKYIKDSSVNTINLLENMLDVSMIETGNIKISPKWQDYLEFINTHILLNQMPANKKEINIKLETNETKIVFSFDDKYLSEVIDNLLSNAIKFSYPKSEIIVRVSITQNKNITTEIIDKGKGIRAEEQAKLFQYFQKSSTEPTAGEKSTGLGLAIAKKIVTLHTGSIGMKSEIDKGSNFYFELPQNG